MLDLIQNQLEKTGIAKLSLFLTIFFLFSLVFLFSSSFKSVSLVSVNDKDIQPGFSNSIMDSFIQDSPESLYQLKSFLESNDASYQFSKLIDIEDFYKSQDIKIFSRFDSFFSKRFHDYYLSITEFTIIDESQSIQIETFGFTPDQSLKANIALIYIASEFFDQRERLSASIALAKKRCELAISKSDDINDVFIDPNFDEEINLDEFNSANALIASKSAAFYDKCLNYQLIEDSISPKLPLSVLNDVNSSSSKLLISEIFDSKMNTLSITDNIVIIAEPIKPSEPERKRILIKALFFFLSTVLVLLSVKVLYRIKDNFIS